MRPAAQVGEVALRIKRDCFTVRQIVDKFGLVRLPALLFISKGFFTWLFGTLERQVGFLNATHARFDPG